MKRPITFTRNAEVLKSTRFKMVENVSALGFGKILTDHLFLSEYSTGSEWTAGEVQPYRPLLLDPAAAALHYGQALFEGLKAFRTKEGKIRLFRPQVNHARFTSGAERMAMQAPSLELFLQSLAAFAWVESRWIPEAKGAALYLRPTLIATEGFLGVRPAEKYLYFLIGSPVSDYYGTDAAVSIWVEKGHSRAAPGGVGSVKAAGNYAASLVAAQRAKAKGYSQVLWLDACSKDLVEEVGTMNVFFVVGNEVWTPQLNGRILPGVTRASVIEILRSWQIPVIEKNISLQELKAAQAQGDLREAFGSGTAAVVTSIKAIENEELGFRFESKPTSIQNRLKEKILQIQRGDAGEFSHWVQDWDQEKQPEFLKGRTGPEQF